MIPVLDDLALGLSVAFSLGNLVYCFLGVSLGLLMGVIPGVGALVAMSLLFPITFHLDTLPALIMLGGLYYGTTYGGSIASILLNLPGTPANVVTCLDGYPMAKQGRAGVALFSATMASFTGASIGILIMVIFSPAIVAIALNFGSQEYFTLMLLGFVAASTMSVGSPIKGFAMILLGVLFGTVGLDMNAGVPRFTFGFLNLADGINLIAVAMGLFGVAEVIGSIRHPDAGAAAGRVSLRSMFPTRAEVRRSVMPVLRGTGIGSFFGALPGTGGTIASFMAYATEKKLAKEPETFGSGVIEGVVAPEAANNAADQTSFIPTLTLGIPGSAPLALILGILMIQGISPGPKMFVEHPDIFWGFVMSFWIGNVLCVLMNVPLINLWVLILRIPYHVLYPAILLFICFGVFNVNNSTFDVVMVMLFGMLGYGMRVVGFPAAPLLLGYVLGPMMEEHFRRAMILTRGDLTTFVDRPISLAFLLATLALILLAVRRWLRRSRVARGNLES